MISKIVVSVSLMLVFSGCESSNPVDDTPKTERKTSFGQAVDKAEKLSEDSDRRNSELAAQANLIDDQDLEDEE